MSSFSVCILPILFPLITHGKKYFKNPQEVGSNQQDSFFIAEIASFSYITSILGVILTINSKQSKTPVACALL